MKNRARIATLSKQRGALAVTTPLLVLLVFMLTVILLDGARLYALKREMQAQVNAAAVAAAGATHSCDSFDPKSLQDINQIASEAAMQQGYDCNNCLTVKYGVFEYEEGIARFEEVVDVVASNAVNVVYTRPNVPISILFPARLGSIIIEVSAAAKREVLATFYSQSSTLNLDTDSSELLKLVVRDVLGGTNVSLDNVSFEALRDTLVDLEHLVADLAGGLMLEDIVETEVTAKAVLESLKLVSGAAGNIGGSLDQLIAAASIGTNISLSEVVDVVGSGSVPSGSRVSVLAVINSTVFNVAKAAPSPIRISVPNGLIGTLTGLSKTTLELTIKEAPRIVVAPARQDKLGNWLGRVSSADVIIRVLLELDLNLLYLVRATGTFPINVSVGASEAKLTKATCAKGFFNEVVFSADVYSNLLEASLGGEEGIEVTAIGIPVAKLDVYSRPAPEAGLPSMPVQFDPFDLLYREPVTERVVSAEAPLNNALDGLLKGLKVDLKLLGVPSPIELNGAEMEATKLLQGIVSALVTELLVPLLDLLGLSVGTTTIVIADAVQPAPYLLEGDGKIGLE